MSERTALTRERIVPEARPRILIVEDEESLADSLRYNLEREGFSVTVAPDGRSGARSVPGGAACPW